MTRATLVRHATMLLLMVACVEKDDPVERWLLCDDCAGRMDVVVGLGDGAVDPLDGALRRGPSAEARDNYRAQAAEEFRLRRRGMRGGAALTPADSTAFVSSALNNLVATYQKRAAFALRTLGSTVARQALRDALLNSAPFGWSPDVLALVQKLDSDDPVTEVTVRSPVIDLPLGGMAPMTATVTGAGTVSQAVTWSTSNAAVGAVTAAGEFTRTGPGPVRVQACSVVKPAVCGFVGLGPP